MLVRWLLVVGVVDLSTKFSQNRLVLKGTAAMDNDEYTDTALELAKKFLERDARESKRYFYNDTLPVAPGFVVEVIVRVVKEEESV